MTDAEGFEGGATSPRWTVGHNGKEHFGYVVTRTSVDNANVLRLNEAEVSETGLTTEQFDGLVHRYHRDLIRLAYAMCSDRAMAEDAAQGCWQAAWSSRVSIRDPDHIRGWLFTVTANEVRRLLRRQRLGELLRGRVTPARPASELNPQYVDLAIALAKLSLGDRQLLAMRYELGLTSEEIGKCLGLSGPGTRRRLQKVLSRLRGELGDA